MPSDVDGVSRSLRSHLSEAPDLLQQLLDQLSTLPPALAYVVIAALAATENVVPPVPADTAVVLGAFLSNFGSISAVSVFVVTWTANVTSAVAVYVTARTVGRAFFVGPVGRRLLRPKALTRLKHLYERHGTWAIFLSRFIPGVRAVVPPFAGVVGLGAVRAVVPMAVASAIWYGSLTYIAANLISRLDDLAKLLMGANRAGLALLSIIVLGIVVAVVARARRRTSQPSIEADT